MDPQGQHLHIPQKHLDGEDVGVAQLKALDLSVGGSWIVQLSQTYVTRAIFPSVQVRGGASSLILPHSWYWVQLFHWVWPPSHLHMQWVMVSFNYLHMLPSHLHMLSSTPAHVILPTPAHAIPIPVLESPMPAHGVVLGVKALIWFISYCRLD